MTIFYVLGVVATIIAIGFVSRDLRHLWSLPQDRRLIRPAQGVPQSRGKVPLKTVVRFFHTSANR
jgi:hypothetical protein